MKTKKTEESLFAALNASGCHNLPEELKEGELWVYSIMKVIKINDNDEYVIARHEYRNGKDTYDVIKDCGSVNKIAKVIAIYPYEWVKVIPEFKLKKDIITYLCQSYNTEESNFAGFTKERLMAAVYKHLIYIYIKNKK